MPLVYPVLAQVFLTFAIGVLLGRVRFASGRRGEFRLADVALASEAFPPQVRKFGNNFSNQFETPVLFYVLSGLAIFVGATSILMQLLAWAYVATRVLHAREHLTRNRVLLRFRFFVAGVLCLIAMWALVLLRALAAA